MGSVDVSISRFILKIHLRDRAAAFAARRALFADTLRRHTLRRRGPHWAPWSCSTITRIAASRCIASVYSVETAPSCACSRAPSAFSDASSASAASARAVAAFAAASAASSSSLLASSRPDAVDAAAAWAAAFAWSSSTFSPSISASAFAHACGGRAEGTGRQRGPQKGAEHGPNGARISRLLQL